MSTDPRPTAPRARAGGIFWIAVTGAFGALLCLPSFRHLVADQTTTVLTHRPPAWSRVHSWSTVNVNPSEVAQALNRMQAEAERQPQDAQLALGAIPHPDGGEEQERGQKEATATPGVWDSTRLRDPRVTYLRKVLERNPNDVGVLSTLLRLSGQQALRISRSDLPEPLGGTPKRNARLLSEAGRQEFLELCERGEALEPNNGFYPTMRMVANLAAGKDEEGLEALHRAAQCSVWRDHTIEEAKGSHRLLVQTFGDHGLPMLVTPYAGVLLPHLSQIRAAGRVVAWRSSQAHEQAAFAREHALRTDVMRLGRTMRNGGDTLIARLVGAAIETIALRSDGKSNHITTGTAEAQQEQERKKRLEDQKYLARVRQEAPELAAEWEQELPRLYHFQKEGQELFPSSDWDAVMQSGSIRETSGTILWGNLLGLLGLWALSAAGLGLLRAWRARSTDLEPASPRPVLSLLLLLGSMAAAFAGAVTGEALFGPGGWLLGLPLVAFPLLGLAGKEERTHFSRGAVAAVAAGAVAVSTMAGLANSVGWLQFWRHTTTLGWINMDSGNYTEVAYGWFSPVMPLASGVVLCVILFSLAARRPVAGALDLGRTTARLLAGALAVGYLGYLLWAVPMDARATSQFRDVLRRETEVAVDR